MSPQGFFLIITALILVQVTHTIGQRKKYRCISEWDRNQRWCVTGPSTTQQPEPPRRIELARTQSKPKPPGSRTVILIRKKSSAAAGQGPSTPFPTSMKSMSLHADDSKPSSPKTKFSPDAFTFWTFPLKFIGALLSPLLPLTAKHNASSSPLVNVQVPMTFSMVHSAAPAAAAVQTYDANGSPVVCRTQCAVYASSPPAIPCVSGQPCGAGANPPPAIPCVSGQPCGTGAYPPPAIPCVAGQPCGTGAYPPPAIPCVAGQPCGTGANPPPVTVPCTSAAPPQQPCGSGDANCTSRPPPPPPTASTNAPPTASSAATTAVPAADPTPGPHRGDYGSPNYTDVYVLLCYLLNQIRPANGNATGFSCPTAAPPPPTAGIAVDNETETIGARPTTTSCAPPTEPSTRPTEALEPADDGAECTPPEDVFSCLMFAVRLHKTAACKPPCPPRTRTKPKPSLCSKLHHPHATASCSLLHHV